jgi:DNA (cytosine-5)-methyltransferase 1
MDIDVDNFCGGGGASTGIEAATQRPVTIAVNHSEAAIAMHRVNHPETRHYREDVWEVDPREACAGRRVRVLWLSPDCTHHSKAKGGQPREKGVRGLAWVAVRWARTVKPRVILLENVEEFEDWGPIGDDGKPEKSRRGETFRSFVSALKSFGYEVDWRRIVAADHGSPTTRRRLFMVARSDGKPIVWPSATHGKGTSQPWRTAAEIIDWDLPSKSIFGRKKPLKEATLKRIGAGLRRYVIESPSPFIVPITHTKSGDRTHSIARPLPVVTTAKGGEFALVTPFISTQFSQSVGRSVEAPLPTITGGGMGHQALIAPTLVQTGYGERKGQKPRVLDLHKPLGTVVSGQKHALVTAFIAKHYGGVVGHGVGRPLGTVTTQDHHSVVTATLSREDHRDEVRAFLIAYYGSERDGQSVNDPLRTVPTRDRFGLVTVRGVEYAITDIGLRMLSPRELFRAQGFSDDYVIDVELHGKPLTKTAQIELAGNSVCPQAARDLAGANLFDRWEGA